MFPAVPYPSAAVLVVHRLCCGWELPHAVLQEVITSKEADQSPRWLAAVQLKNSIIKHWRPQSGGK